MSALLQKVPTPPQKIVNPGTKSRRFSTKVVPGLELEAWLLLQGAARWRSFKVSACPRMYGCPNPANILI
jgi:hypothetical protein